MDSGEIQAAVNYYDDVSSLRMNLKNVYLYSCTYDIVLITIVLRKFVFSKLGY